MSLQLNSVGGGSVIIAEPNTASHRTVTLPDASTTLVGTDATQTLTNKTLVGVTDGSSAAAGKVGEYVESQVPIVSGVSAGPTGQFFDITSITLTAGDWDMSGMVGMYLNGATITGLEIGIIGTVAGNSSTGSVSGKNSIEFYNNSAIANSGVTFPTHRVNLTGSQTYYLKGYATYSAGTPKFGGFISARRVR